MRRILVLFSGGADSTLLLFMGRVITSKVGVVIYQYGQKHEKEIDFATSFLHTHPGLVSNVYYLSLDFKHVTSPLLSCRECQPRAGVHENHVPARNLIFVAHAAAIAESQGFDEIWYGADYSDRVNLFPDCTQEWVVKMNQILAVNGSCPLVLKAPLLGMPKEDIIIALENCGVRKEEVFSGYAN